MRDDRQRQAELIRRLREFGERPTPYNLTVHAYANLTLDATLRQDGFAPGDAAHLTASLWEYQVPLLTEAMVWADVSEPDGKRTTLPFSQTAAGDYRADWATTRPGVYQFVIHAEGRTTGNARFTREKVLTAGVWAGGDRPFDPVDAGDGGGSGQDDGNCKIILCLVEHVMTSPELQERFKALGIDLESLRKCLETQCRKERTIVEGRRAEVPAPDDWPTLSNTPEFRRLMSAMASVGLSDISMLEAPTTTPVTRRPKLPGSNENMFILPGQEGDGGDRGRRRRK